MFNKKVAYICTMCGTLGVPKKMTKGSFFIELALWLLFFFPGAIYTVWRHVTRYMACSVCESAEIIPGNTPIGHTLINQNKTNTHE